MVVDKTPSGEDQRTFTLHIFAETSEELVFHWSVGRKSVGEWTTPETELRPKDSAEKAGSVQTSFAKDTDHPLLKSVKIKIPADKMGIKSINYVLYAPKSVSVQSHPVERLDQQQRSQLPDSVPSA